MSRTKNERTNLLDTASRSLIQAVTEPSRGSVREASGAVHAIAAYLSASDDDRSVSDAYSRPWGLVAAHAAAQVETARTYYGRTPGIDGVLGRELALLADEMLTRSDPNKVA